MKMYTLSAEDLTGMLNQAKDLLASELKNDPQLTLDDVVVVVVGPSTLGRVFEYLFGKTKNDAMIVLKKLASANGASS